MPTRPLPARGQLAWIQISFSISLCVGFDRGGARQSFAVGTVSPLGRRPALVRMYPWHSPVARSGRSFPASRNTEKALSWMRQIRSQGADTKDSDGEFAYR